MRLRTSGAVLVAALLVSLVALLGADRATADAAQVTVVSPGGAEHALALEALAGNEDVVARSYALRDGSAESAQVVTGFSLAKLIEAAGADPFSFSYLEVQRPGGGAVQLSRHQALAADAFPDGPPVVYAGEGGTAFLRPSAGPGDANAADSFLAPQGVRIVLSKGTPLRVRAVAGTVKVKPGQRVSFEAVVEQAGAGEQLTFSWSFDDGGSAKGERVVHAFKRRGSYDVVLGATSAGNPTGASAVVTVQVGAPIAGPDRKGGGRNDSKDAPDHGAAAGPASGGGGGGTSPEAPVQPEAAEAAPPATARFESGPMGRKGTTREAGRLVRGELLSAEAPLRPEPRTARAEARRGSLDGAAGGGSVPAAAWGGLAAFGLLGIGALLEGRGLAGFLSGRRRGGLA